MTKTAAVAGPLAAIASVATAASTEQFDLNPKAVLTKGENNSAFLISWRSQREVAKSLAWKSALYIWCGPALTLLGVYVLLAHLGWL
jgi:hypothetical protein